MHHKHYRKKHPSDHVRAVYLCSMHPKVQEHTLDLDNHDPENHLACRQLLKNLIFPGDIVNKNEQEQAEDLVIDTFLTELGQFKYKQGVFWAFHN